MARLVEKVVMVLEWVLVTLFALLVGAVFLQVVGRHVFQAPPYWTEEAARYFLVWISFLGAALAHHHNEHIRVELFASYLPHKVQRMVDILISLIILVLMIVFTKYGYEMTNIGGTQVAPATGINMRYVYASLPVASILMALLTLFRLSRQIREIFRVNRRYVA